MAFENDVVKTIEYRGHTINVIRDPEPQSPKDWDNDDAFLVYDHRQFSVEVKGFDPDSIFQHLSETNKSTYEGYWAFPVYAYIHSGVALSLGRSGYPFNDRWDVSFKGFALVKRQKGWTYTHDKAIKVGQAIVDEWNQYLSGEVYGFQVLDSEGDDIDSCWGFYGDFDKDAYVIDQAKAHVDHVVNEKIKTHIQSVKQWIKNKIALVYRKPFEIQTA
jgi:hypothetical protein